MARFMQQIQSFFALCEGSVVWHQPATSALQPWFNDWEPRVPVQGCVCTDICAVGEGRLHKVDGQGSGLVRLGVHTHCTSSWAFAGGGLARPRAPSTRTLTKLCT